MRSLKVANAARQEQARLEVENSEDDLVQKTEVAIGLMKAVLENVIFCHQEDSTWPLADSKTLKAKFDDIFAATRYTKALNVIRKLRKERIAAAKEMETDLKLLESNCEQVHRVCIQPHCALTHC